MQHDSVHVLHTVSQTSTIVRLPTNLVRLGDELHAEAPHETAGGGGGIAAVELHVVKFLHAEPVRARVRGFREIEAANDKYIPRATYMIGMGETRQGRPYRTEEKLAQRRFFNVKKQKQKHSTAKNAPVPQTKSHLLEYVCPASGCSHRCDTKDNNDNNKQTSSIDSCFSNRIMLLSVSCGHPYPQDLFVTIDRDLARFWDKQNLDYTSYIM